MQCNKYHVDIRNRLPIKCFLFYTQAYRKLLETERLLPENTDVRAYEVDGVNYLARTD